MKILLITIYTVLIFAWHWIFNVPVELNTSTIILMVVLAELVSLSVGLNQFLNNISVYEDKEINDKL